MPVIVSSILALIQAAPQAISEITNLYNSIKADISESDQATIDAALAAAQRADADATNAADTALDAAANRP